MTSRPAGRAGSGGDDRAGAPARGADRSGRRARGADLRRDPAAWVAGLARSLRRHGVPCTPTESRAALEALDRLDVRDVRDVYFGLRAVLLDDVGHRDAFDRCFRAAWRSPEADGAEERLEASRSGREATAGPEPAGGDVAASLVERLQATFSGAGDQPAPEAGDEEEGVAARALYSPHEALGRRDLGVLGPRELREAERAFDRLRVRLSTRRGRRTEPSRGGRVDMRRSFRDALRHDGELLRLARRRRRVERPRVVLLCDVSGSMERYSRFVLRLLLSAGRERDVEAFVFGTRLTRLGRRLRGASPGRRLERVAEAVPDWSGGTRIGACLEAFLERYGRTLLGRRTVVVILSDGLERGDVESLRRAMRGIGRRARRVVWLNPLAGSPDYEPSARGMAAALPWIDDLAAGASLDDLRRLPALLSL